MDTEAGPNLVKKSCLSRPWADNAVKMETTRFRSAASTQLEVKKLSRLDGQLRQSVAEVGFLVVTNLATAMILDTAYIDENNEKIKSEKSTLKPTGSCPVAIEESVGNAA